MVKLSEMVKTETLTLPISGATVEVVTALLYEKAEEIRAIARSDADRLKTGIATAIAIIRSWTIAAEDGTPAPITEATLRRMFDKDVEYLCTYGIKLLTTDPTPAAEPPVAPPPADSPPTPAE